MLRPRGMFKLVASMAGLLIPVLGGAGCECDGFDSLELTAKVHSTSDRDWESTAGRSTKNRIPVAFTTWEAAIHDTATAAPGSGIVVLNGPGGLLHLAVPFPLSAGQTLPVVDDATVIGVSFAEVGPPRPSIGAHFEDFCSTLSLPESAVCADYEPPIQGSAQVVSTKPLLIHVDFGIEAWPGGTIPPYLIVRGDLVFGATRGRACPSD